MIPVLFSENETQFNNNGIGRLIDATECITSETLNAEYELKLKYPVTGTYYENIKLGAYVYALPYSGARLQAFEIYKISKPIGGIIDISAEHLSYRLNHIPVMMYSASTAKTAFNGIKTHAAENCPFTFITDINTSKSFILDKPTAARTVIGGGEKSIVATFGGELEYDMFNIKLLKSRGKITNRILRYGKDLISLTQEENIEKMITGVCPYYEKDERIFTLDEKVIHANISVPYHRTLILDCSKEFEHTPSQTELKTYAIQYMKDNNIGKPSVSIDLDFIELAKTLEYHDIIQLENIKLGDIISVKFEKLKVDVTAKIVSYEFDVLKERYTSLSVGDVKPSLAETLKTEINTSAIARSAAAAANRYRKVGSKTVTLSNQVEVAFFSMSELDNLFGLPAGTCTNTNTIITASNADNINNTAVAGITYNAGAWHIRFSARMNASVLVAYTANFYGEI